MILTVTVRLLLLGNTLTDTVAVVPSITVFIKVHRTSGPAPRHILVYRAQTGSSPRAAALGARN